VPAEIYIIADDTWAKPARDSRAALKLLGWNIDPKCLPDEANPCGASFAMHAMAHYAAIKALCDHQLEHLGPAFEAASNDIYETYRAELENNRCQMDHHGG
jgi:hypothetical protein